MQNINKTNRQPGSLKELAFGFRTRSIPQQNALIAEQLDEVQQRMPSVPIEIGDIKDEQREGISVHTVRLKNAVASPETHRGREIVTNEPGVWADVVLSDGKEPLFRKFFNRACSVGCGLASAGFGVGTLSCALKGEVVAAFGAITAAGVFLVASVKYWRDARGERHGSAQ